MVDVQGRGAPAVTVEQIGFEFDPPRLLRTDAEGNLQIPRETTNDHVMLFARRDDQSLAWTMVGNPTVTEVEGTKANPIVMKLLPLTHRVAGSVLDREGKPIPGAEIVVTSLSHPTNRSVFLGAPMLATHLPRSITDQAGRFALILPEATDVSLSARHSRYLGEGMVKADVQTLEPMVLVPAGGIAGTVTDAATGQPAAGVIFGAQLIEWRKQFVGGWGDAVTDDQGRFVIIGLEPGVYNLLFMRARGREQATARAVEGLRVRAGAETPANLILFEGRPLRGVVIEQETEPPCGRRVGWLLRPCTAPVRGRRPERTLPTHKDASRSTFLLANITSTSWMAARPAA